MSKESGLSKITTDSLVQILDTDSDLFLLDVREPDEVAEWRIPGVNNIPLGELDRRSYLCQRSSSSSRCTNPSRSRGWL